MKLLGITEMKITNDKYGENIPNLEINEVILVHCNVFNNSYQEFCIHLFQMNHLVSFIFY